MARVRAGWLAVALAVCACAINPVTGERELVLVSAAQEAEQGRQAAAQVERQIGLVRESALVAYVESIGQRLARHSPRQDIQYRFFVAAMPEPNAFALPGGYIYVSRGLLAIANSEDELANVIGHEIGHVAARHSAQRQTRALGVGLLAVLGAAAAGRAGGEGAARGAAQLGELLGSGLIAAYSRDQERQADDVGQKLAARAGWDPAGMASFLQTLERDTELQLGRSPRPSFLDSHPATQERVAATAARARSLRITAGAATTPHAGFLARIEGILLGPDPAEGVTRDELFLHPAIDFALRFPSGWQVRNGRSAVMAVSPAGDAALVLETQGKSGNPRRAALEFAQSHQLELQNGVAQTIGGFAAWRADALAQGAQGPMALRLTWIAHPKAIFRLTGLSSTAGFREHAEVFSQSARSFRRLSTAERGSIRERRLRAVQAQRGETIAGISQRTGNVWTESETAVANGLAEAHVFRQNEPVKIAVESPWRR